MAPVFQAMWDAVAKLDAVAVEALRDFQGAVAIA